MAADREFCFTYHFGGSNWGISIFANDPDEAREKIKAVGMARYDGEVMGRIPATVPAAGMVARLVCWWKNRRGRIR